MAPPFRLSQDAGIGVMRVGDSLGIWAFEWDLDGEASADWDEGARPYLATFLAARRPWSPEGALVRTGRPSWAAADLGALFFMLGCAGYGSLRPDAVRREVERMTLDERDPGPS